MWGSPALLALLVLPVLILIACTQQSTTDNPSRTLSPTRSSPPAAGGGPSAPTIPSGLTAATVTRVVDGDTIVVSIGGQEYKLRYIGIDTPETVDPRRPVGCFGKEASARNRELVEGRTVDLEKDVSEVDTFGRLLRYVWLGDRMVNAQLVEEGYAHASTYPPDVRYAALFARLESEARSAGRGLWGPACQSAAATQPPPATAGCEYSESGSPAIKGNMSPSTGEKIYHVPGGAFYDQTVIDEAKGERWFCTEADAVAAGWRKSKS